MDAQPGTPGDPTIEDVKTGQKMVLYAIVLNFAAGVARATIGNVWILIGIAATVLAIAGLLKLANGLGYSTGVKVLLVILSFIPIVSLIMLALLSGKATERLRAAGYKVGLMGARDR